MSFFSPIGPLFKGWLVSVIGFGLITVAMSAQFLAHTQAPVGYAVRGSLRDWLPWIVLTPLIWRFVDRYPIDVRAGARRVPLHLAVAAVVLLLCFCWEGVVDPPFQPLGPGGPGLAHPDLPPGGPPPPRHPPPRRRGPDLIRLSTFQLPLYLMILSAAHAALFYRRDREREASLTRARLDVLTMQLQPHFLFNTLNTIAEMVHQDAHKADAMITGLSEMLRLSLDANAAALVPLQREAEFIERYFEIMQVRFGERITYQCDIPPEARTGLVPPFLLQPLVENAIRHGLEPRPEGGKVLLRARVNQGMLRIWVCDNGVGLQPSKRPGQGLGLTNTRERLRQLFDAAAGVEVKNEAGVEVQVWLPFRASPDDAPDSDRR